MRPRVRLPSAPLVQVRGDFVPPPTPPLSRFVYEHASPAARSRLRRCVLALSGSSPWRPSRSGVTSSPPTPPLFHDSSTNAPPRRREVASGAVFSRSQARLRGALRGQG